MLINRFALTFSAVGCHNVYDSLTNVLSLQELYIDNYSSFSAPVAKEFNRKLTFVNSVFTSPLDSCNITIRKLSSDHLWHRLIRYFRLDCLRYQLNLNREQQRKWLYRYTFNSEWGDHVALICGVTKKPRSQAVLNLARFKILLRTEGPSLRKRGNH